MKLRFSLFLASLAAFVFPSAGDAALTTYTDPAAYLAQLTSLSLTETAFTNFESLSVGTNGTSITASGIQFTSPDVMRINSGITSSASNYLGINDLIVPDFSTGDRVTITLPANSRAIRLNVITDTLPDLTFFASLFVGNTGAITVQGPPIISENFRSYFLGLIDDSNDITSAVLEFDGTGPGEALYRVDDVGVAGLSVIPEPGSLMLVATGLLGFARRRRA